MKAQIINKEQISRLQFSKNEVLKEKGQIAKRNELLRSAVYAGNLLKQKVKLFFVAEETTQMVETTVWHADSEYVVLKAGAFVPVRSIIKIEF
jgi:Flp pilus assembly CpaE family ATPase